MEDTTSTGTTETPGTESTSTATAQETTAQTTESAAPRSFSEAVDRLKAQDEAASTTGEAATTAQQTPTDTPAATTDKTASRKAGPIPFDVHEKALTNARTKAVEDAKPTIEAEIRKAYAWADAIEPADRNDLHALYRGLKTDLIGTLTTLIDNASQHPEHAKTLRSQAARLLSAARRVQGDTASDDEEPPPDIPLEDGRAVYSADQQRSRDAWLLKQVSAHFDRKLQPFQQDREHAAETQRWQAALDQARGVVETLRAKPHFSDHEADILALMHHHPDWTVTDAYNEVLVSKVLPAASQKERAAVLADIHHKAGAGTLNPTTTTTASGITPDGKFTVDRIKQFFEAGA